MSFSFLAAAHALAQHDVREQVYVHLNSQMFVVGETMHFATYCNSQLTGNPSSLSKIMYVEIVGENGPVYQQKIYLKEGTGSSDFFIPSLIPSGRYYLIAYTRWMKNFNDYFQSPLLIINPFEAYLNEPMATTPEMDFFPLHDPLVAGVENVVAFKLRAESPLKFRGRLVGNNGALVSSFSIGRYGLGTLKFIPEKGQAYQVILEDAQGQIYFYDLPEVAEDGAFVVYHENKGQLVLQCAIGGATQDSLILRLSNRAGQYQTEVFPNVYHTVPQAFVSDGLSHVQYSDFQGKLIAERSIFLSDAMLKKKRISRAYGTRQKVTIETKLDSGAYSVSVRKKTNSELDGHQHAIWNQLLQHISKSLVPPAAYLSTDERNMEAFMLAANSRPVISNPGQVNLLPEIREEILTGNIRDSTGNPAAEQTVALTLPGNPFQLRIGKSNEQGDFFIPFQSAGSDTEGILTVMDYNHTFSIRAESPFLDEYPDFNYHLPYLDSSFVKEIIQRSIRVQIANAYFDFLQIGSKPNRWSGEIPYHDVYSLDDYKRFPTLKETFTEFIVTANVRENRDYVIKSTYFPGLSQPEYPPLVLLDGVPVSGEKAITLNPYRVASVGVLPNRYFLGPLVIDGIVGIKTFDGDYGGFQFETQGNHQRVLISGLAEGDNYSFLNYAESTNPHEADQRDQLYWEANFRPEERNSELSFYTSDVPGEYEIVVEGFTQNGRPVTKVYEFLVE